ncbi:Molybdopterin biosynthesis protein MoeA / CTP:molybdopterin cytidylyltransferase [hydrothermal vent metagenome]|uniref:Molybdopterin biosynthesis protein MoeA / CTP:molybdopterin cytidylyltransferase n=2 Tax=ecological metagenomes TaxID=410657 RepID=A0A160VEY3_9ZZZZ
MKVSAIILAAGQSSRMENGNKLLLPINEIPMISHVCNTVLTAGLDPVVVVTGFESDLVTQAIPTAINDIIYNSHWQSGMASSIYEGLSALPQNVDGNMIVLGDMPMISKDTLTLLIDEFIMLNGQHIIYPIYEERQANPVIFPKKYFQEILSSTGDRGCKKVLKQYPDDVVGVSIGSPEVVFDCDSEDNYFRLLEEMQEFDVKT